VADVISIFTTHLCLLFIIFRAVQLDRTLPWFEERQAARGREATGKAYTGF